MDRRPFYVSFQVLSRTACAVGEKYKHSERLGLSSRSIWQKSNQRQFSSSPPFLGG